MFSIKFSSKDQRQFRASGRTQACSCSYSGWRIQNQWTTRSKCCTEAYSWWKGVCSLRQAAITCGRTFRRCTRCKKAYYCSKTCQEQQWNGGHKKACRKPDQIKLGDYMMMKGLKSKPELNCKLVHVVRPASQHSRALAGQCPFQAYQIRYQLPQKSLCTFDPPCNTKE